MRIGTLVKLTYGHIRQDVEAGITPVNIHVEEEVTKGKYHAYDTFVSNEAVKAIKRA